MVWQAGPISRHDKAKGKQIRTIRNSGLAKWQREYPPDILAFVNSPVV